jgi:hypothetical protein
MRREKIAYTGPYHHVMNRGYDSSDIFAGNKNKSHFLDYLISISPTARALLKTIALRANLLIHIFISRMGSNICELKKH